ncbi:MAG TPA: dTDP-4-dehydrorhamnose reductase [Actinomycetota bacterium]|nr:dTDP-4-dehydrorhamnose reductase [Actinomycetota bacterium]
MRILVTGGAGQLGRAFAALLPEAQVVDRAELDIADSAAVERSFDRRPPDVVYNTAAYTAVDRAEVEPDAARRVNVDAVANLAAAAARHGTLLVQYSTDYVFPGDASRPYSEEDRTGPLSVYGRTKLEGELAALAAGCRCLVIRTSWVFGQGHNFVRSILGAAAKHPELTVVDDQRGRPTYAPDLAEGSIALVEAGCTGVFHLSGGGEAATWADVAEAAIEAAGLSARVRRVTTAQYYAGKQGPVAPRPANSELDCSKARRQGVALRPWSEAVAEYVKELVVS